MRFSLLIPLVCAACNAASGDLVETPPSDANAHDVALDDVSLDISPDAVEAGEDTVEVGPAGACRSVSSWSTSAPFVDASHTSHPLPSFARGGFFYVHTQASGADRILRAARMKADGTLDAWFVASPDHGGGPHGYTAIVAHGEAYHFRNGHIARYPFDATTGAMTGDVVLLEKSVDTSFGGNRYVWDSAVYAAFGDGNERVVHLGGFSFVPYAYAPDVYGAALPMPSSFTATGKRHPADRPGKAAFFARSSDGFVYTGESGGDRLWSARVTSSGALDAWTSLGTLPAGTGNQRGDFFLAGRTLFVVRGASVFAADVRDDGSLGAWTPMPSLPADQIDINWGDGHLEGASYGTTSDAVFLTGPKVVFGARLVARACGS
ncbi:MAG: hypothetical protein ACXWUG_29030 [Polyangiales bacterium]